MRELDHFPDRVDRSQRVGQMDEGHQLRPRAKQLFELVHLQLAAVVDGRNAETGVCLLAQQLPRDDVRMVLHMGDENLVPRADVLTTEALRHEIDAFRRIAP